MDSSHAIAKRVWEEDTEFYASRGVKIHSLEVTRYQCADSRTSEILEQIIQEGAVGLSCLHYFLPLVHVVQETTNRMNRLSQAESENEADTLPCELFGRATMLTIWLRTALNH